MARACNRSEVGFLEVQGLPGLQKKFKTSLGSLVRLILKQITKTDNTECSSVVEHFPRRYQAQVQTSAFQNKIESLRS